MKPFILIALALLMSGCSNKQIEYESVKTPTTAIPANLTSDVPVPYISKQMTFGDSVQLNFTMLDTIGTCNYQLGAIRAIEAMR